MLRKRPRQPRKLRMKRKLLILRLITKPELPRPPPKLKLMPRLKPRRKLRKRRLPRPKLRLLRSKLLLKLKRKHWRRKEKRLPK